MGLPWGVQALRHADGMGGAALAPTLLALLPSLLRLQVFLFHCTVEQQRCMFSESSGCVPMLQHGLQRVQAPNALQSNRAGHF